MRNRHKALAGAVAATLGLAGAAFAQSTSPSATTPNLGASGQPMTQQQAPRSGGQDAGATAQSVNPTPMAPGSRAGNAPGMGGTPGQGTTGQGSASQAETAPRVTPADPSQPQGGRGQAMPQVGTAPSPAGSRAESAPGSSVGAGTAPATAAPGQAAAPLPGSRDPSGTERPGTTAQRVQPDGTTTTSPAPAAPGAATGTTTPAAPAQGGGEARRAGAPLAGANSFTEGQARARIGDAGYADVQELRLDEQGVWRGRAMRNGQMTGVAMDYQGNIVATP
ncbi:hypothetical protein [Falsiroseomonas sp.]|uniref:hypothetical protein n=1 Tax=Falsiroseomonas sp. TaxID=2870721 RepID=UPI003F6EF396